MFRQDQVHADDATAADADAARPSWVTPQLIALTLATWQPYYSQTLTDEDAVEMLLTVGNLYRVLATEPDPDEQQSIHPSPQQQQDAA